MTKQRFPLYFAVLAILILALAACQSAQPTTAPTTAPAVKATPTEQKMPATTPAVTVSDQEIVDGTVTVAEVDSDGPGWIVIHAQADGKPGPILGFAPVADGVNRDVVVEIDAANATETLYAMLHTDAGEAGTFEFPDGPDGPVKVDGKIVTPPFMVSMAQGTQGTQVNVTKSMSLGTFLVDADGMTLYIFMNDEPGKSNCSGGCAQNWPPLLTDGAPVAGDGVDAALLGTVERSDGGVQVTYNGWPLYYFAADAAPGDTNGQGVASVWYVIGADGEPITAKSGDY